MHPHEPMFSRGNDGAERGFASRSLTRRMTEPQRPDPSASVCVSLLSLRCNSPARPLYDERSALKKRSTTAAAWPAGGQREASIRVDRFDIRNHSTVQ